MTHASESHAGDVGAAFLNLVFTRVVNHCVTVVGLPGIAHGRAGRGGESFESVTSDS
jgi:hypothetical protein